MKSERLILMAALLVCVPALALSGCDTLKPARVCSAFSEDVVLTFVRIDGSRDQHLLQPGIESAELLHEGFIDAYVERPNGETLATFSPFESGSMRGFGRTLWLVSSEGICWIPYTLESEWRTSIDWIIGNCEGWATERTPGGPAGTSP